MTSQGFCGLRNCEGKGLIGCMLFIVLTGMAIFLAIRLGPIYYSNFNFESDLKEEVSRAGAHLLDEETVISDIVHMAGTNGIRLTKQDIKLERFAGQIHIQVNYAVPVDFIVMQRSLTFQVKVSSFTM